ncbi:short transient receptor potential channel 4-like [Homalodisca vitripennis]|uniref:short transient receptor potential channel 4-like n=1 Tax=Homalodisca vitripennis TaxID=197043 RepID=UPI001EEAEFB1|nr:short transient receptor potential channel 4-like [Homalodisca vitripennis]
MTTYIILSVIIEFNITLSITRVFRIRNGNATYRTMRRFSKTLNRISEDVEGETAQQVRYSLPEMIFLGVKDSKELEERQRELEYFKFVSAGDIEKVNECLTGDKKVSVNCINYQGLSALHLALKNNDTKMVEYLLKRKDLDLMDCALYAVKLNQTDNVERIFNKLKTIHPSLEFSPCINSAEFPEYLTPLIVAAQCGHIEMIHFLFSRGHPEIPQPHKPTCVCSECVTMMKELDPLLIATKTFDTYKAICSHAYIPNVTNDPILMVFHLVEELKEQAVRYRLFHSKYDELIEETEKFAADLIAFCRNTSEVSTVLMTKEGSDLRGNVIFPRLVLAVEYDQKLFVAETNVQEVLQTAWVEDWYAWRNYSKFKRSLFIIGRMISIVYVCFTCLFRPKSDDAKFYNIPVNRMVTSVSSYIYFLILLYLESSQEKKGPDTVRYPG